MPFNVFHTISLSRAKSGLKLLLLGGEQEDCICFKSQYLSLPAPHQGPAVLVLLKTHNSRGSYDLTVLSL